MTPLTRLLRAHLDFCFGLAAALLAPAIAIVAVRAWLMDVHVPLRLGGDSTQVLAYVRNMMESGTPLLGPRLGAPFGQQYHDFPLGADNLNFAILRAISVVTGDAVATVNLFYLLTFALVAVTAYWALRSVGVARPVALFAAVVYAVVPFHFIRNTGHLFLAAYYAVPLAAYVLVRTVNGKPLFGLGSGRVTSSRIARWGPVVGSILIGAVIASTGGYYAAFTLILIGPAAVLGWLRSRSRSVLASAGLFCGVVVVVMIWNVLPSLLFWSANGPNPDVPARFISETGLHQLRPLSLLIPIDGHHFPPFARLASEYLAAFPPTGENGESAGLVAAAGFVLLIVVALGSLVGAFSGRAIWRRERGLAALTLVTLIIASSGSVSALIAVAVTSQIRAWARLSIFIDFFALLAVALLLTLAWRWLRPRRWRNLAAIALVAAMGVAAFDQTTGSMVPAYATQQQTFALTSAFVSQVESALPAGAAVYQMPYRAYPEGGASADSPDYDPLLPYLVSHNLRLSYGGVKGREAGWQLYLYRQAVRQMLPLICTAGFAAIWVDRLAYEPGQAEVVEAGLSAALGVQPLIGVNERYAVYDVQAYCANVTAALAYAPTANVLRDQLLRPVWVRWLRGATPITVARINRGERLVGAPATLALVNDGQPDRQVTVSFNLLTVAPAAGQVEVTWPDGSAETLRQGAATVRTITLAAGSNPVQFRGVGDPVGDNFVLVDLWAVDPDLLALATT